MGKRFNRPSESVFFEALYYRLKYLPIRTVNNVRHAVSDTRLRAWRIKNVDIPYWRQTRGK